MKCCEGCSKYKLRYSGFNCIVKVKKTEHEHCPCVQCLVKTNCSDLCKLFIEYYFGDIDGGHG